MVIPNDDIPDPDTRTGTGRRVGGRRRPAAGSAPPKRTPKVAGTPRKPRKLMSYRDTIGGIVQAIAAPLAMLGQRRQNHAFIADAATLAHYSDALADAVEATADVDERFSAVMDKLRTVGPYAALLSVASSMAVQLAHNHNVIPAELAVGLGAQPPEALVMDYVTKARAAHAAAVRRAQEAAQAAGAAA